MAPKYLYSEAFSILYESIQTLILLDLVIGGGGGGVTLKDMKLHLVKLSVGLFRLHH